MSVSAGFEPGARLENFIPLCVPELRGRELEYVRDCIESSWVSSVGAYVTRFEEMCAAIAGTRYAVATVTGTAALHVALLAAGVLPGDEVVTSALTFIAPANAIRYTGAWPVFVDAEPRYWQLDVERLAAFLADDCVFDGTVLRNARSGRRVRAILPVSILGHPVQLDEIIALARRYHLTVIEDATESLGASYQGRPVGGGADVSCFSFNGNKLTTTGGGGMIVTNDGALARRARYLTTQAKDDPIEYVHGEIGFNYRLTNVAAAIGVAQLEQLTDFVAAKRANAARYANEFGKLAGITLMPQAPWAASSFWLYTVLIDEAVFGCSSRAVRVALDAARIQTRPLWQPMHRSPAHAGAFVLGGAVADRLCRDALSLPSSVGLRASELSAVADAIRGCAP
jgi:perosamine synthetase